MAELILRKLRKNFGQVVAVNDVTLRVPDGEFLVLLGPSGCGKSTILRLIAGLEDATSGEIVIDDRLVNFMDPVKRNVAMVFQNYALYPHMTVFKNVAFPLETARKSKADTEKSVRRVASLLEIDELLDRLPEQLSGGQRQRVALARAIVREPVAFLMDEPLSNLDAQLRLQTRLELMGLHQRLGITTVYVTHDQVEAMTMGQRIAVMEDGNLQQLGLPDEVYDRPANTFVARFMGAPPMNLLAGSLVSEAGAWRFVNAHADVSVDPDAWQIPLSSLEAHSGEGSLLGVRPEDLSLVTPDSEAGGRIRGRVRFLEPVGSDLFLTVESGADSLHVRTPPRTPAQVGDDVTLAFEPSRAHLFGSDSWNLRGAQAEEPVATF